MRTLGSIRRLVWPILAAHFCFGPSALAAQVEVVPDIEPQCAFAAGSQKIRVIWHNAGKETVDADVRTRLLQTTSATAVQFSETTWKRLQVLPGQTVVESAALSFPMVKAESRFLIQWLEGTNTVLGTTELLVYPTSLLAELRPLAGDDEPLGVFDPGNVLKPLLKPLKVEFADLENARLDDFRGKLAIVGPFASKAQMPAGVGSKIKKLAEKGAAVVWILPPPETRPPSARREEAKPSFYTVTEGKGAVVVVRADVVDHLAESPQAQLNLIQFARLALRPEPLQLPDFAEQP